jgi:hypothetical protein
MVRGAIGELVDVIRDARGSAESSGHRAAERAGRGSRRAGRELSRIWTQVEDLFERNVGEPARDTARRAEPYWRDTRHHARARARQLRGATQNHPVLAIGVAVAGTLLITSLLSSAATRRSRH